MVARTAIVPVIDMGIGGKDGGQIGAGIVKPPMNCFDKAIEEFNRAYG